MQLVFSDQALPSSVTKSLFLAGPSPRTLDEIEWRQEAIRVLKELNYDGTVFVPVPSYRFQEGRLDAATWDYTNQVSWEVAARKMADVIAFWIPRVIDRTKEDLGMPGLTTNFEMGEDLHSAKLVYGRPDYAVKCRYLDMRAQEFGLPVHRTLDGLLRDAVSRLGTGSYRKGGERNVPLFIWQSEAFQAWYANLKAAGNRLDDADLSAAIVVGKQHLFAFVLHVNVWVESEQRHKSNERVFFRKDVSSVVAVYRDGETTHLALVREFRSTVSNPQGFVYEFAGGSTAKSGVDPQVNAQQELSEEMGLLVADESRFRLVGNRQLAATFSSHKAQVYAIELTREEFARLKDAAATKQVFGDGGGCERTFVEVTTVDKVFELPVDYSTLGMLFEALRVLK